MNDIWCQWSGSSGLNIKIEGCRWINVLDLLMGDGCDVPKDGHRGPGVWLLREGVVGCRGCFCCGQNFVFLPGARIPAQVARTCGIQEITRAQKHSSNRFHCQLCKPVGICGLCGDYLLPDLSVCQVRQHRFPRKVIIPGQETAIFTRENHPEMQVVVLGHLTRPSFDGKPGVPGLGAVAVRSGNWEVGKLGERIPWTLPNELFPYGYFFAMDIGGSTKQRLAMFSFSLM